MHILKNSWQFSFKITEKATSNSFEKPQFTCETHNVCQGYALLVFCVSVACFKDSTWQDYKQFFQVITILS